MCDIQCNIVGVSESWVTSNRNENLTSPPAFVIGSMSSPRTPLSIASDDSLKRQPYAVKPAGSHHLSRGVQLAMQFLLFGYEQ